MVVYPHVSNENHKPDIARPPVAGLGQFAVCLGRKALHVGFNLLFVRKSHPRLPSP